MFSVIIITILIMIAFVTMIFENRAIIKQLIRYKFNLSYLPMKLKIRFALSAFCTILFIFNWQLSCYYFCGLFVAIIYEKIFNFKQPVSLTGTIERGTGLLKYSEVAVIRQQQVDKRIWLGYLFIPKDKETMHTFIIGATGTGKTNTFNSVIQDVIRLKHKAIIHDTKGDYIAKFYNQETDYILNPLDERCMGWNIWNDITRESDFVTIANTLIKESTKSDPFFYLTPRRILADILQYLWNTGQTTNKAIWQAVNLPINELSEKLKLENLPSANDLNGAKDTASNLMSTVVNACQVFKYMQNISGDFSIQNYINDESNSGLIFLSNKQEFKEIIKPVLALFVDFSTMNLLSLDDNSDRRLFFLLDEFNSLSKLNSVISLLTLSRSKGGAVFIGTQDFGEIDINYTKEIRNTIINNCSNSMILRLQDPDTADYFSKKIGEVEMWETSYSDSSSKTTGEHSSSSTGNSSQDSKQMKKLILPNQIQNLQNLKSIVTVAGIGTFWASAKYIDLPNKNKAFIEKALVKLNIDKQKNFVNEMPTDNFLPEIQV